VARIHVRLETVAEVTLTLVRSDVARRGGRLPSDSADPSGPLGSNIPVLPPGINRMSAAAGIGIHPRIA